MPHGAPDDVRLPHVDELPSDVATMMIARAFAEIYRDVLEEPVPERLTAILRRMDRRGGRS
ncbi:NepR family anti-sigma factor [Microvirga sp. CF3016]|uniref:NepR family anti-sigma factor n=1 Tax=Microvirga sp. CF3016 TaxID=3110181 RepID=UPI002E787361|nr:NepR family anti-sigma factor [Microvirga sp. CF3016]MEE1613476.1 NepR family anti-sigma factor [Microvirga sp. CF3016]